MKTSILANWRPLLRAFSPFLIAIAVLWAMPRTAQAQVYIAQVFGASDPGFVSEYSTKGKLLSANFITGLNAPAALAVSGNNLFVVNSGSGTVGKYDASTGGAINAGFITGLNNPAALALSGNNLFVTYYNNTQKVYEVGEYDATTGAAINTNFITGLNSIFALAVLSNKIFVTSAESTSPLRLVVGEYDVATGRVTKANLLKEVIITAGRDNALFGLHGHVVGEYNATTGAAINAKLITGLHETLGLAVLGDKLFVANSHTQEGYGVGEYDAATGAAINANLITGLDANLAIAVKREQ
jgi:hypothetical protein